MVDATTRRSVSRVGRGGWLVFGPIVAAMVGCVTPARQQARPTIETIRPHAEPELVTELPPTSRPKGGEGRVSHTVEPGQTLYRIARTYEVEVDALMKANGITDPTTLAVGQKLVIPGAEAPKPIVPPGAQEAVESHAPQLGAKQVAAAPPRRSRPPAAVVMPRGEGVLKWPLRGVLYARFGKKGRERHDGIDLAAPSGTPVRTAKAGRVLYAGEQKGYGRIAIIDHGDGLITLYAHNRDLRVRTGQKVRDGQVIATVGESGRTSGPHLHFEVRKNGVPTDPLRFLGAPPDKQQARGRRGSDENR